MIHYHGGPITPRGAAISAWTRRHAMISFANPDQLEIAAEVCQSFSLDNGAYPLYTAGDFNQRIAALTKQQPAACFRSEVRGVENNNA